jgi:fibro-slime domain-containing protein
MSLPAPTKSPSSVLAAIILTVFTLTPAFADALTGNYYVLPVGHPDVEHDIDGLVTGLVQANLGPDGFPVVSALGMSAGTGSHPITDIDPITHEILWWTPGQDGVTTWKTGETDSLPFTLDPLFPFNDGCDGPCGDGYVAAYWTGTFDMVSGGAVTFNLGSDDDAWIFVDGVLQVDDGGIHGLTVVPTVTTPLSSGSHDIAVFFADRHTVAAAIDLSADVTFNPSSPVPEPSSTVLLGTVLLLFVVRFGRRKAAA